MAEIQQKLPKEETNVDSLITESKKPQDYETMNDLLEDMDE